MPINDTIMLGIILLKHLLQQYSYDNRQNTKYQGYALPIIISLVVIVDHKNTQKCVIMSKY